MLAHSQISNMICVILLQKQQHSENQVVSKWQHQLENQNLVTCNSRQSCAKDQLHNQDELFKAKLNSSGSGTLYTYPLRLCVGSLEDKISLVNMNTSSSASDAMSVKESGYHPNYLEVSSGSSAKENIQSPIFSDSIRLLDSISGSKIPERNVVCPLNPIKNCGYKCMPILSTTTESKFNIIQSNTPVSAFPSFDPNNMLAMFENDLFSRTYKQEKFSEAVLLLEDSTLLVLMSMVEKILQMVKW